MELFVGGLLLFVMPSQAVAKSDSWASWWTYEGISGPAYWGLINPAWTMCNKGRAQSPVNIDPGQYHSSLIIAGLMIPF